MIAEIITIIPLALSALQDLKYKAVSDAINFFMLIFSPIFYIYHILLNGVSLLSILFTVIIPIFFYILYLNKAMGIGDVVLFTWLSPLISIILSPTKILLFLAVSFLYGAFVSSFFSSITLLKNRDYTSILLVIASISIVLSIFLFIRSIEYLRTDYLIVATVLIGISNIILLVFGKRAEKYLYFKRKPSELVEGDWVEDFRVEVKEEDYNVALENLKNYLVDVSKKSNIKNIINQESNKIKNIFNIEKRNGKIILSLHKDQPALTKKQILLLRELEKLGYDLKFTVKEGYPFVPAIFLAYITILLV